MQNKHVKKYIYASAIIALFTILTIGSGVYFLSTMNDDKDSKNDKPNTTNDAAENTDQTNQTDQGTNLKAYITVSNTAQSGAPAACQPLAFDPKISKYSKIVQEGQPSVLYKVQGFNTASTAGDMMINGWLKENEDKITLPQPYKVTEYRFGCASSFSSVLELTKNNVRQALYQHVLDFKFSNDGKYLYLVNNELNNNAWVKKSRIIDIQTKNAVNIPAIGCVSNKGANWSNNKLLTYAEKQNNKIYTTDLCVWDLNANLIARMDTNSKWMTASSSWMADQIGVLPKQSSIIYTYSLKDSDKCALYLIDTAKQNEMKSIDILEQTGYSNALLCMLPNVEFDLSNTQYSSGSLRYKVQITDTAGATHWGAWQTISIEGSNN